MSSNVVAEMADTCLIMRSRLISRVLTNIYDDELRPFAINSPQFVLLVVMSSLGPSSRADIGRFHHQDRSTLTRNLAVMLEAGWVEEVAHDRGGRSRPIAVTEVGSRLQRDVAPAWRRAQEKAKFLLGTAGTQIVTGVADEILHPSSAA